jgi:hypothetical protein
MSDSIHLALPYIAAAQAQKHVTHNEALRILDALVMLSVKDRDLSSPPGSPAEGDCYLVNPTGTGGFAGKDNQIAHYRDGGWAFHAPQAGWLCYVEDEDALIVFDGDAWGPLLQNVARLGIGTEADALNPFSAKLNNALWTARYDGEGGDGSLRYKLNKESAADTLSMLFQTGWSGRAEIGLSGDDDLHVKVSDDGSTWRESIVIAAATGKVSFPQGALGLREKLTAARTYYVRPDGDDGNDGLSNTAGGAFATIQKAVDVVFGTLDLGGFDVTIQLADGSYSAGVNQASPQVGAGLVTIQGNAANPENVVVTVTGMTAGIRGAGGAVLNVKDFELRTVTTGFGLLANTGASISYANMRIGPTAHHHIRADDLGSITCLGNYAITGNGMAHWCSVGGGILRCQSKTITLVGTPAFSAGFVINQISGMSIVNGNTFSGSATGKRYDITTNSVVYVAGAGASYLPGDVAGTAATGAQYA